MADRTTLCDGTTSLNTLLTAEAPQTNQIRAMAARCEAAMRAGLCFVQPRFVSGETLAAAREGSAAVADGKTTRHEVERALRNLFRLRIRLGLLDPANHRCGHERSLKRDM